jgi:hypothetical protein
MSKHGTISPLHFNKQKLNIEKHEYFIDKPCKNLIPFSLTIVGGIFFKVCSMASFSDNVVEFVSCHSSSGVVAF